MKETARDLLKQMKNILVMRISAHDSVADDIVRINLKRLIVLAAIAIPFSLIHIVAFLPGLQAATGAEHAWRIGIIIYHSVLVASMTSIGLLAWRMRNRETVTPQMRSLQYIAAAALLWFGISIVVVDRLVTTNITPFLVVCTILGSSMLIRPRVAVLLYAVGLVLFSVALGITQADRSVLLSNRLNGLTSIGIAMGLSILLWNSAVSGILQKRRIDSQQQELEEKNRELQYLVCHDPMTNLFNRRRFEDMLTGEIAMVRRYGRESSLIMLDIDGFKAVNDKYGHPAGDSVVRHVASILKANVRETDALARWGGDEFILLLPCTSAMEGKAAAEKLGAAIRQTPIVVEGETLNLTASFGVTAVSCSSESALEQTIKDADLALYMAKGRGRDCVAVI